MFISHSRQQFLWRLAQIISRQGVTFVIFFLGVRYLSPEELSSYVYVIAVVSILSLLCDFGISTSVSKISAESVHRKDEKYKMILTNSLLISFAIFAIITSVLYFFAQAWLSASYQHVLLASPLIFLMPAASILDGYYRGLQKFKLLSTINIYTAGFFIIAAVFATKYFAITGAIIVQACLYLVLTLILSIWVGQQRYKLDWELIIDLGKSSLAIGLIGVGYFLYTKMDIIILKEFNKIAEIGMYETLNKIIMLIGLPFMVFATITGPKISKLYVSKKWHQIRQLFLKNITRSFRMATLVAMLALVPTIILLKFLFPSFELDQIALVTFILFCTYISHMVADVAGNAFIIYTGFYKLNMYLILAFGILNVALDILLIPIFGFNGAIITKLIVVPSFGIALCFSYYLAVSKLSSVTSLESDALGVLGDHQ